MRLTATLAAGLVTATATLLPTAPAEAQHYRYGYYHGGGYHGYRHGYGYRSYGYHYRQPYRGYGFHRFHGGYGYHGGRVACRRFYYHHRLVRSCRQVRY